MASRRRVTRLLLVGSLLAVAGVVLLPAVYELDRRVVRVSVEGGGEDDVVHAEHATVMADPPPLPPWSRAGNSAKGGRRRRRGAASAEAELEAEVAAAAADVEKDPLRAGQFASDWVKIYRVAVLWEPDRGPAAEYYSWRRMLEHSNLSVTCTGEEAPHMGMQVLTTAQMFALVHVHGPCVRVNPDSVAFAKRGAEPAPPGYIPTPDEYPGLGPGWLVAAEEGGASTTAASATVDAAGGVPVHRCADAIRWGAAVEIIHLPEHMDGAAQNIAVRARQPCAPTAATAATEPIVLFVRRNGYASLYQTFSLWLNAVESLQYLVFNMGGRHPSGPVLVVFLDAHPAGPLDSAWATLFGRPPLSLSEAIEHDVRAAHALLISPAMTSPVATSLYGGDNANFRSGPMQRFAEFLLLRHGFSLSNDRLAARVAHEALGRAAMPNGTAATAAALALAATEGARAPARWITVIFRREYPPPQPVPRTRLIANERDVYDALAEVAAATGKPWRVRVAYMEALTVREQLAVMRSSAVIVAMHDEVLCLAVAMRQGSMVVELQPVQYQRDRYVHILLAAGIQYYALKLDTARGEGPYNVDVGLVATAVASHLGDLRAH